MLDMTENGPDRGAPIHSMSARDRAVALDLLCAAWSLVREPYGGNAISRAVRAAAHVLTESNLSVDSDYSRYAGDAAVWYLDRATRRIGDPDRSGLTAARREQNLTYFGAVAMPQDIERLFAMAAALNAEDL